MYSTVISITVELSRQTCENIKYKI